MCISDQEVKSMKWRPTDHIAQDENNYGRKESAFPFLMCLFRDYRALIVLSPDYIIYKPEIIPNRWFVVRLLRTASRHCSLIGTLLGHMRFCTS